LSRHEARATALQMLFQMDVGENPPETALFTLEEAALSEADGEFAKELAFGTQEKLAELDALIRKYSYQWDVDRLANVDRNVLRLALYEMFFVENIPHSVTIDEAIELAKLFSTEESKAFINGVLDTIYKNHLENKEQPEV